MNNEYNIYCDESDTNGQNIFWLGAVICTPARADILNNKIKKIREKYDFYSEFKWTKLKGHNFNVYKEFIDVFFDDRYIKFRLMSFKKNRHWTKWEISYNKRMAKTYYCFIGWITMHYCKYNIYADQLFNDHDRSMTTISYLLNSKRRAEWGIKGRNINAKEIISKNIELVQLTDVLMGAYKSNGCTNRIKNNMSNYVKNKMSHTCKENEKRFEKYNWEFRENK